MTAGIVLACYAVAWLAFARLLYGRWRVTGLHHWEIGGYYSDARDPEIAGRAMLAALLWPTVILTALVRFRPPPTAAERAAHEKKLKARIAELEREAGIRA
jgi:hypothetical protein